MIPRFEIFEVVKFMAALSVCMGAMAAWRRDGPKEDAVVAEAADVVLESLSNADMVNKIELHTGRDLRDQLTWEQAEALHNERETRRWPNRN